MSFESMLIHKCDVYHIIREDSDMPDITDLKCKFGVKSGNRIVVQTEPRAEYQAKIKLTIPFGTDIRLNDKIIDKATDYEYTADIPVQVQNHHLFVMISRKSSQESL